MGAEGHMDGWSRRRLLGTGLAGGASLAAGLASPVASASKPRYLVVVLADGGWDQTHCLDPKLGIEGIVGPEVDETGAPGDVEELMSFGDIEIATNSYKRPRVTDWFSRWYQRAHVINGVWMGAIAHNPCRSRILSGTPSSASPDFATIAGYTLGTTEPLGTLDLSGWSQAGSLAASSGRVGFQSQLKALIDPSTVTPPPQGVPWRYPLYRMEETDRGSTKEYLARRAEAFAKQRADGGIGDQRVSDLVQSRLRADEFRHQSQEILDALIYPQRPDLGQQVTLAVDMMRLGVCKTVTLVTTNRWDTHAYNVSQHAYYDDLFDKLDQLATELEAQGMLEETLVAVISEMGRAPWINADLGKDHWGHTSALLFGGGVRGASLSGATNDQLESRPVDYATGEPDDAGVLLKYDNLVAGILSWMDVDPEPWLPSVKPFTGFGA